MNRKEREADPAESFDGGYHLIAPELHKKRVAKNPQRLLYATNLLSEHGIEFSVKNETTGHIHCRRKTDDALIQFWAGTGKIMGYESLRGIHNLVKICEGQL